MTDKVYACISIITDLHSGVIKNVNCVYMLDQKLHVSH